MSLTDEQTKTLAEALYRAERERKPIAPLTDTYPEMDVADAYAVQQALVGRWIKEGGRIAGWKVGLTSKAVQKMLGVDRPDFGHLLDTNRVDEGTEVACSEFIWPKVEPEIAFILNRDLRGPNVTRDDVMSATEYLVPALELVDSRIRDWKIKLGDTIADNASCGRFVVGRARVAPGEFDIRVLGMNYLVDGELVSTATGAAVLGDPAAAVAWVANALAPLGQQLKAGQFIMPGSLVGMVDAKPGMTFTAIFDRLGSVSLHMV
jgi:2-keto-4-pentenoate hydratase